MAGLKQIVHEIEHQQRLHPVIGEAFPELGRRKPAQPSGMAQEDGVEFVFGFEDVEGSGPGFCAQGWFRYVCGRTLAKEKTNGKAAEGRRYSHRPERGTLPPEMGGPRLPWRRLSAETGIDGFRCDVAHMVPVDFWDSLRAALDSVRPVFMLAEADQPFLHKKAYDASYDWKFHGIMNQIAKGKLKATEVARHFAWVDSVYPGDSYLMQFTSNHDENSWNGTEYERMGEGARTFAVLCATLPDMLLIYNGQESAFNRRLQFFEKDSISWGKYELTGFYKTLIALKKKNSAIWNGNGGRPEWIKTSADSSIVTFIRRKEGNEILVMANLSPKSIEFKIKKPVNQETFKDVFTGEEVKLADGLKFSLKPWEYIVAEK